MTDLLCVVADKNMEAAISSVLGRPEAVGIRRIRSEVLVHPRRDPGCFHESAELIATRQQDASHALVVLDAAWQGAPASSGEELESLMEREFARRSLDDGVRAVVIDPELEAWVFSESPHVPKALGWSGDAPSLRRALESQGMWKAGQPKPQDPKAVVEGLLRRALQPRSSSFFRGLASTVGLDRCVDRSFVRLRSILRQWFPRDDPPSAG